MDGKPVLNVKSLKEQVYEYLREQMRRGEILPGSAIDMEVASKKLGVSKPPLRDALLQLEMEDFVTILPRRMIIVNSLTERDIRNYYEIIGSPESLALLTAFPGRKGSSRNGRSPPPSSTKPSSTSSARAVARTRPITSGTSTGPSRFRRGSSVSTTRTSANPPNNRRTRPLGGGLRA